jgi:hypothetical protein
MQTWPTRVASTATRLLESAVTVEWETVQPWWTSGALATADEDYRSASGTVVFAPYETTPKTIEVTILDDCYAEEDEDFAVYLTGTTGGGASTGRSAALVTIIDNDPVVQIDLDVNNNGSLGDAVDGVANFLPGYVGDEQSLTPNRVQQVQLIVSGLTPGITVDLELVGTTALPGIACNFNSAEGAYPSSDDDKDFVFGVPPPGAELTADAQGVTGVMVDGDGRITVPLLVRDFGGRTTVRVLREGNVLGALQVPLDTDGDTLPDLWEDRYAVGLPTGFTAFDKRKAQSVEGIPDADRDDDVNDTRDAQNPNDPAVRQGKVTGDLLPAFDEYRGFFVGGTHLRTSPIIKTLFIKDELGDIGVQDKFALLPPIGVELFVVRDGEFRVEAFGQGEPEEYRKLHYNGKAPLAQDVVVVRADDGSNTENDAATTIIVFVPDPVTGLWKKRERICYINVPLFTRPLQLLTPLADDGDPVPLVLYAESLTSAIHAWARNGRVMIGTEVLGYETGTAGQTTVVHQTSEAATPAGSRTVIVGTQPELDPDTFYNFVRLDTGEVIRVADENRRIYPVAVTDGTVEPVGAEDTVVVVDTPRIQRPAANSVIYARIGAGDNTEWISYAGVEDVEGGWRLTGVTRGLLGTEARAHAGDNIPFHVPYQYQLVARGQCGTTSAEIPIGTKMTPVGVLRNVRRNQGGGSAPVGHDAGAPIQAFEDPRAALLVCIAHELAHAIHSDPDKHFEGSIMKPVLRRGEYVGAGGEAGLFETFSDETRKLVDLVGRYTP